MSGPYVVALQEYATGGIVACLSRAPTPIKDMRRVQPLAFGALPSLRTKANVVRYGRKIESALSSHDAIRQALERIFAAHGPVTLHFDIQTPAAEPYRWETLCDAGRFFEIDLCRFGRMADSGTSTDSGIRIFRWPLRMAAFLSAAGISAGNELETLIDTVKAMRALGLRIECNVYLGEPTLIERTQERIAAGELDGFTVRPIPANPAEFQARLSEPAEFLHFFCHGLSGAGVQLLEFATISDWNTDSATGSSLLSIDRIELLQSMRRAWLTVLNCCDGGRSTGRLNSMAYKIVADGGCPAAIGMCEPIDPGSATVFAAALYRTLFETILQVLGETPIGRPVELDFMPAVAAARFALHARCESGNLQFACWSLPVIYLAREHLHVQQVNEEIDEIQSKLDLVAGALRNLAPSTPDGVRDDYLKLLDLVPVVPPNLRPDRWGYFS